MEDFPRQISRFLHQTTFSELWFSPIFYKKWDQLFRGTFRSEESLCSLCSTRLNQKYVRTKFHHIHPCKSVSSVVKNLSRSPCSPRSTRSIQCFLTAALFRILFRRADNIRAAERDRSLCSLAAAPPPDGTFCLQAHERLSSTSKFNFQRSIARFTRASIYIYTTEMALNPTFCNNYKKALDNWAFLFDIICAMHTKSRVHKETEEFWVLTRFD